MPCTDPIADAQIQADLYEEVNKLRGMLCLVLTNMPQSVSLFLYGISSDEASKKHGITPDEVLLWWQDHQRTDKQRETHERAQKTRLERRKKILSKLTKAERKELGFAE